MPEAPLATPELVVSAVRHHLPGRTVVQVEDRGVWIRHNFRLTLDGGEIVHLKLDRAFPASEKEAHICALLERHGLPAPRVLALDATCEHLPVPFIIQAHISGERLGDLLARVGRADQEGIYRALGRFYRRLHTIHHDHSGWIQGGGVVLLHSPTAHMHKHVIDQTGGQAVERRLLAAEAHRRLQRLWSEHRTWLEAHRPSLVTGGALSWAVYLAQDEDWHVTKIMDLHDLLYWDPAWDVASVRYPVFRDLPDPELWRAFASSYGSVPDEKRLQLYRLVQHLDAAMGNYVEPAAPHHARWKANVWATFEHRLDAVEGL
jgi:aminoglycoside phosphotransferase (APT) family kinase protein